MTHAIPRRAAVLLAAAALLTALPTPASAAPAAALTPEAVDEYLTETIATTGSPGISVVVTHDDEIVHAAGYGHDGNGDPMTADTRMRVASLSKAFTATAVLRLADTGAVALDEPVADQLPGFTMSDPRAADITVRQLLDHTSGLSDTTLDMPALSATGDLASYMDELADGGLARDPGTGWEYCNANFEIAARLVETVDGRDFPTFVREELFTPLGMTATTLGDTTDPPAPGYNSLFGLWIPRDEIRANLPSASGGVVTTATDMGRWLVNQAGHGPDLLTDTPTAAESDPGEHAYRFGWGYQTGPDGEPYLVHSGNLFTYNAAAAVIPGTGHGFAVLSNDAGLVDVTYTVLNGLMALSRGERPDPVAADRQTFELVLALVAAAAVAAAVTGALRSRRWASRHAHKPAWRIVARLVPAAAGVALLPAYPYLVEVLVNGRHVTWEQLTRFPLPLTVTVAVVSLAAAVVAAARLTRLRAANPA
ncbi:CubicO group peptidase (beta-lactamase class C family) [Stackebrandtia albiflava]|uniref:CubicO group peptidase (Beta-lactamase class C family) n=1 Tax=Stackebrandtia albiflava TaxID=406432 RepID=A0A562UYM1_9ACTN|nr:serine hydrolase domain-containing protein [Stackebrandtia albiflava]TWJ10705.1 CubicO group peptidase (beta-lactamase class C family) [Stackebrandtia albiflava]